MLYIFQGNEITNFEMLKASRKQASAPKNLNVKRGDRIVLQMPNHPEATMPPVLS